MVEGPKVLLKKERLRPQLQNEIVLLVAVCQPDKSYLNTELQQRVVDVVCVGKELFLELDADGLALRLHFGMSGTEEVVRRVAGEPFVAVNRHPYKPLSAYIVFQEKVLYLYETQVSIRRDFRASFVERKLERDVMSGKFNLPLVRERVLLDLRAIQEVLLDQDILPGVGNVIKCEALFRSGIHPETPASSLSPALASVLLEHTHQFSWQWYEATKKHNDVVKVVYGHENCTRCRGRVRLVRFTTRITYYCDKCQASHRESTDLSQPLLDFNIASSSVAGEKRMLDEENEENVEVDVNIPSLLPRKCQCGVATKLLRVRKGANIHRVFWSCSKGKMSRGGNKGGCNFFHWADASFPTCSRHQKKTVIRRVLKDSTNNGRYFYACSERDCSFFQWADEESQGKSLSSSSSQSHGEVVPSVAGRPEKKYKLSIPL